MEDIAKFLQNKKEDIGTGSQSAEDLLKEKSMRCIEIPWVILKFLKERNKERVLDLSTTFFDRKYFKIFFNNFYCSII